MILWIGTHTHTHTHTISDKISRTLDVINRLKRCLSISAMKLIYDSLIFCHLQFGITGVKQCTFHWLISSVNCELHVIWKQIVFHSLIIYHFIMFTCISHGNIFAISVTKCSTLTREICVTMSGGNCNTDSTGVKWNNINIFLVEI